MITLFRGDDTTFKGEKRLRVTISTRVSLAGCSAEFELCGLVKRIPDISTGTFYVTITGDETRKMPCGVHNAVLRAYDDEGRCRTIDNAIRVSITERVDAAYTQDDAINVHLGATVKWRDVVDKPSINGHVLEGDMSSKELGIKGVEHADLVDLPAEYTGDQLRNAINAINDVLRRSMAALVALLLLPLVAFGAGERVTTARWGSIKSTEQVVTSVDLSGLTTCDGTARPLPKYLYALDFADSYAGDAEWYYAQRNAGLGGCSAVRDGNAFSRNFDFPLDERAEFVVRMEAGEGRFASVGVAQVGTNLTEDIVRSGRWSRYYKCLPGATVDGINSSGVAANINVVGGNPGTSGWRTTGDIHPLGAVRWVLDHATDALDAATNLALRVKFPAGWTQNFHYMICDTRTTYVVENGAYSNVTGRAVMTNFGLIPWEDGGAGHERYDLLAGGASITNAWYSNAYLRSTDWASEFTNALEKAAAKSAWETYTRDYLRGKGLWQSVHTSVYDLSNRVLRVAAQEQDDWYVFNLPASGGVSRLNDRVEDIEANTNIVFSIDGSVLTISTNGVPLWSSSANRGGSGRAKRYAMLIVPLNWDDVQRYYTDIELKASTNNFTAARGHDTLVFHCCSHLIGEPDWPDDDMRIYVENHPDEAKKRMYTAYTTRSDWYPTHLICIIDASMCHFTQDHSWLDADNDELVWTYARGTLDGNEVDDNGAILWRPIAPVRWFSELPAWANQ